MKLAMYSWSVLDGQNDRRVTCMLKRNAISVVKGHTVCTLLHQPRFIVTLIVFKIEDHV